MSLLASLGTADALILRSWDGSTGDWSDGARWLGGNVPNNGQPGAGDRYFASIDSGTVTRDTPITISEFAFFGGTLTGGSTLNVLDSVLWDGGTIQSGSLLSNGLFHITGETQLRQSQLILGGSQLAQMDGSASLTLKEQSTLTNQTHFAVTGNTGIYQTGPGNSLFTNSGTFSRNTDDGLFTVAVPFENTGEVKGNAGTLAFTKTVTTTGGSFDIALGARASFTADTWFDSASPFTGGGEIEFNNGVHHFLQSADSNSTLLLSAGEMVLPTGVALSSYGAFHAMDGAIVGGGLLTAHGGLHITGGLALTDVSLRVADSQSGVQSGSGMLTLNGGAIIDNLGTYQVQNDGRITPGTGAGFAFHNQGTLVRDTSAGVFTMAVPLHNSGTVEVQSGTLVIAGGGASTGIYHVAGDADLNFSGNTEFSSGSAFTGEGRINLLSGTQTIVDSMASADIVNFSGGVLNIAASRTFESSGAFFWSGGTLTGSGTLQNTGSLDLTTSGLLDGTMLHNAATGVSYVESSGSLLLRANALVKNDGIFYLLNDGNISAVDALAPTLENTGTISRDIGTGSFSINVPLQNSGTVRSNSGAILLNAGGAMSAGALDANGGGIYLNGGTYDLSGGDITGSGFVYLTSGTARVTENSGASIGSATGGFAMLGGTLHGNAMLSVDRGYFHTGQIAGNVVLRLSGASTKTNGYQMGMSGGTVQNDGTYTQGTQANWDMDNSGTAGGGTILNRGDWTLNGSCYYYNSQGGGSFINQSAFRQAGGYNWMHAAFHNGSTGVINSTSGYILLAGGGSQAQGSVLNANGGDIYFYGGTHELAGGTLMGSSFVYASVGTVSVNGTVGAGSGAATGGFGVSGATITGTGMLSAERGYFSNGQISGNVVLRFTGASTKENNYQTGMSGGTIQNEGAYTQGSHANWDMDNSGSAGGGTILNRGDWTLNGSCYYYNSQGGGSFINQGSFHQASGYSSMHAAFHNGSTGVINSTSGYILLAGGGSQAMGSVLNANGGDIDFYGGTHELNGGTLTGSSYVHAYLGTVNIKGNVGVTTGPATGGFGIIYSTIGGSAMISAGHGYFVSGQITGDVVVRITGPSTKEVSSNMNMDGGTFQNEGTFTQATGANWDLDNAGSPGAGTLFNKNTWHLTGSSQISNTYGGGVFRNAGTLHQSGGNNLIYARLNQASTGLLNATGDVLRLLGGSSLAIGNVLNADGGTICFQGGTHEWHGGSLTGSSTVYANGGAVILNGNINSPSGPAIGGFGIASYATTVTGTGTLSAERGDLGAGTITGSPVLRFTGASSKATYTTLYMNGGTIQNDGTFTHGEQSNYDVDSSDSPGAGTLDNKGTWNLTGSSQISNTYGGGVLRNSSTLIQSGGNNLIYARLNQESTGVLNATGDVIRLLGGSSLAIGSILNADGGTICFQGGTHEWHGGSLTGSSTVYANGGTVSLNGNINSPSGPATGGFGIASYYTTVTGTGTLSAERGDLGAGTITGSPVLRFTGASSKATYTTLYMNGGTIQNDGTFTHGEQANYDVDSAPSPGAGTLDNKGAWNLTGSTQISNSYGGGVLRNSSTLIQSGGNNLIYARLNQESTGVLNATGDVIRLLGGSSLAIGNVLNADGGTICFQGGTHEWHGGSLTGSSTVYANGGTVSLNGNINSPSGPATGGFGIASYATTVTGTGTLSAERGDLGAGTITGSPVLRFTGASSKATYTTLYMHGGTIQNDGTFIHGEQANYDVDGSNSPGGGTLDNMGTWHLTGSSQISNTYGEGVFLNAGTLMQSGGGNVIYTPISNSGSLHATGGTLYLYGGSTHTGALVTDSHVVLGQGTHTMNGPAARLGGAGALSGNLSISDGARIAPETLTLYGHVAFVAGGAHPACEIRLAGPGACDAITIAHGASLDLGNDLTDLRVTLQYAPANGDIFRIVSAGGNGHFTGVFRNLPATGSTITASYGTVSYDLKISYDASQQFVDLTVGSNPYLTWATDKGLLDADAAFGADPDRDGIPNGVEFLIGGEPNPAHPNSPSTALLPRITVEAAGLRVVYRRNHNAVYLTPSIEYNGNLSGPWSLAQQGVNGVEIQEIDDGFALHIDRVEVLIPRSNEVAGSLFARLTVRQP